MTYLFAIPILCITIEPSHRDLYHPRQCRTGVGQPLTMVLCLHREHKVGSAIERFSMIHIGLFRYYSLKSLTTNFIHKTTERDIDFNRMVRDVLILLNQLACYLIPRNDIGAAKVGSAGHLYPEPTTQAFSKSFRLRK